MSGGVRTPDSHENAEAEWERQKMERKSVSTETVLLGNDET